MCVFILLFVVFFLYFVFRVFVFCLRVSFYSRVGGRRVFVLGILVITSVGDRVFVCLRVWYDSRFFRMGLGYFGVRVVCCVFGGGGV